MATIGTTYREGKAMRMHLEKITPSEKEIRELVARMDQERRERLTREHGEAIRRVAAGAHATGAVIDDVGVWVDHPSAEGRS